MKADYVHIQCNLVSTGHHWRFLGGSPVAHSLFEPEGGERIIRPNLLLESSAWRRMRSSSAAAVTSSPRMRSHSSRF